MDPSEILMECLDDLLSEEDDPAVEDGVSILLGALAYVDEMGD